MESSRTTSPGSLPSGNQLAREAIGLREVLFQSITHMAPAAAVAITIVIGANFAGGFCVRGHRNCAQGC